MANAQEQANTSISNSSQYYTHTIPEFKINQDDWNLWFERLEIHFDEIECTEIKQKRSILLRSIGAAAYAVLHSVCDPEQPRKVDFKRLCQLCSEHFSPPTIVFRERKKFYAANKNEAESITEWFTRVKSLAINCKFGASLNSFVLDRFVCGIDGKIFERLCEEDEKTELTAIFKKAMIIESKYGQPFTNSDNEVNFIKGKSFKAKYNNNFNKSNGGKNNNSAKKTPCACCGWKNHQTNNCKFKEAICNCCNQKGHLASICKNKSKSKEVNFVDSSPEDEILSDNLENNILTNNFENFSQFDSGVARLSTDECNAAFSVYSVNAVNLDGGSLFYKIPVEINGIFMNVICDTGAPLSLMSHGTYMKHFSSKSLQACTVPFTSYGGNRITVVGKFDTNIKYRGLTKSISMIVTDTDSPILLARNFLRKFKFELVQMNDSTTINAINSFDEIIAHIKRDFSVVFDGTLGAYNVCEISLQLEDNAKPVFCKPRAIPFAWKGKIEKQLNELVQIGVLEPIDNSDWGTPLVPILKPNGSIRICGDYKSTLNRFLIDVKYPLPRIEEVFASLQGGRIFTKLDLSNAYNQLLLDENSQRLCAWSTHIGLFKMKRLPFGVKPASAIFQKTIENLLRDIPRVVNYMDDIVITGTNFEEHIKTLKLVLSRLRDVNLKLNIDKCEFFKSKITYLGFNIDSNGLSNTKERVESVLSSPIPENISEVRAFVGLVNYYSQFIPNFANKMIPLYQLLQKENDFVWTKQCQTAFEQMKSEVTTDRVLVHFDPTLPIILETDASQNAIAGVLSHKFSNGTKRPIAFVSRSLSKCERNYSVIEKEALAIIFSVTKLRQYLLGQHFELDTDHKPLLAIFGPYKGLPIMASARMQRWALILSGFNYSINHIKGVDNHADSLSRMNQIETLISDVETESSYINYVDFENVAQLDFKQIALETRRDIILAKVREAILNGKVDGLKEPGFESFRSKGSELTVESGCVLWGYRTIIPEKFRKRILYELHKSHLGVVKTKALARSYIWWPKIDSSIEQLIKNCHACQIGQASPEKSSLIPWVPAGTPWERIHIDFAGPLKGFHFLIIIDSFSKWVEVFKTKTPNSHFVITKLREIFCRLGLVDTLVSDNGAQFTSEEFKVFLTKNRIKHKLTAPGQPATNGQAEIFVKMLKKSLKANLSENASIEIDTILHRFLADYRSTQHCTTGETPFKIMFGREMKTRFSLVKPPLVQSRIIEKQEKSIENHRGNREKEFLKGQSVYIRDYANPNKTSWMQAQVQKKIGPRTYGCVISRTKRYIRRHLDQIREGSSDIGSSNVSTDVSVHSSPESKESSVYLSDGETSTPMSLRPRRPIDYNEESFE